MGRCPSTISRELRRNRTDGEYFAAQAQGEARAAAAGRPLVRKMEDPEINEAVRGGLAQEWSPEQIEGRMRQEDSDRCVSSQTIYTWIKQDEDREHWESLLPSEELNARARQKQSPPDQGEAEAGLVLIP